MLAVKVGVMVAIIITGVFLVFLITGTVQNLEGLQTIVCNEALDCYSETTYQVLLVLF